MEQVCLAFLIEKKERKKQRIFFFLFGLRIYVSDTGRKKKKTPLKVVKH